MQEQNTQLQAEKWLQTKIIKAIQLSMRGTMFTQQNNLSDAAMSKWLVILDFFPLFLISHTEFVLCCRGFGFGPT